MNPTSIHHMSSLDTADPSERAAKRKNSGCWGLCSVMTRRYRPESYLASPWESIDRRSTTAAQDLAGSVNCRQSQKYSTSPLQWTYPHRWYFLQFCIAVGLLTPFSRDLGERVQFRSRAWALQVFDTCCCLDRRIIIHGVMDSPIIRDPFPTFLMG